MPNQRKQGPKGQRTSKKDSDWYKNANASKEWLNSHQDQLLHFYRKGQQNNNLAEVQAYIKHLKGYIYGPEGQAITTTQLRNIYDKVRRAKDPIALQLVRPLLAYAAARQGKKAATDFVKWLDSIMALVNEDEDVKSFKLFMEAVIAYHKFCHPKSN